MDKKKLLDQVQAAKDCLADVWEQTLQHEQKSTIGDVIEELATRPDIDIYILERALSKRCYPDREEYICVEVDHKLASDSPGRAVERQKTAELLASAKEILDKK